MCQEDESPRKCVVRVVGCRIAEGAGPVDFLFFHARRVSAVVRSEPLSDSEDISHLE